MTMAMRLRLVAMFCVVASHATAQTVQYRSPAGVAYKSMADTGAIARAERALAADPRNVTRFVELGVDFTRERGSTARSTASGITWV